MREIVIDCSGIGSTGEFWQRYLDAVQSEGAAIFGRNLNAFWDAIEGGGPGWPGEVSLVFTHVATLSALQTRGGNASFLGGLRMLADKASAVRITLID